MSCVTTFVYDIIMSSSLHEQIDAFISRAEIMEDYSANCQNLSILNLTRKIYAQKI